MKKLILFLLGVFSLTHTKAIANQPLQQNKAKSFIEYCQQKSTLPKATKDTVEILLKKAGTQDCQQANRKLSSLTKLNLQYEYIGDLQLLSTLTNLTHLNLKKNGIKDIKPLSTLTNLTYLNLGANQIEDIAPLSTLTNLTELHLNGDRQKLQPNEISDITPL
ncbi:MAG: leucine-rich repeat domain-containing protein, partial [Cyanobacteria bacterium J06621_15]